jgi:antitoxin (DNA-binding transcriptional repressor) of toxin-antitoxin stability system
MHAIGIGQFRGDLRNYVERVATGETFVVWRRGRPVARFYPAHDMHDMLLPVQLSDLRTRASRLFDRVTDGETIAVEYRGRTVAALQSWVGEEAAKPRRIHAE